MGLSRRRATRALLDSSELSACSIRQFLLADVAADLFQLEPDGRYHVTAGSEMFAREVSLLTAQAGDCDGALSFQEPDHRCHWVLGRNRDTHVHVVRHQMALDDLTLFLSRQRVKDHTQLPTRLAEDGFPAAFGHENDVVLAVPFRIFRVG